MENDLANYKIFVEIYKGYLDTALTGNIWFYTLTGAVVANYLSKKKERSYLRFSLVVPFIFGVAVTVISGIGIGQAWSLRNKVYKVAQNLEIQGAPPVDILTMFLVITGVLSFLICFGLGCLFFWWPRRILDSKQRSEPET
jgi:hypothetical protein